ncbi:DUF2087 domain-containing protein [Clostridium sp. Marseille-P299]|uniref:DUF2087 domain-containing protein n=1 Tax=Clostridium sp. Marseille-P299 TaxID=1805477 RepID=UPI0009EEE686|nr:DUF2087 domain-containing protein [Clostridium sp. Marseille-P299]
MDYRELLQRYLTENGKLKQYPSKKSLRMVALAYITEHFERNKKYKEKEVNEIIMNWLSFSDHELIRRELIVYGFMNRMRDGSAYWVEEIQPDVKMG